MTIGNGNGKRPLTKFPCHANHKANISTVKYQTCRLMRMLVQVRLMFKLEPKDHQTRKLSHGDGAVSCRFVQPLTRCQRKGMPHTAVTPIARSSSIGLHHL